MDVDSCVLQVRKPIGLQVEHKKEKVPQLQACAPRSPHISALCIGINEYKLANQLGNCDSDALAVGHKLQELE